MSTSDPGRGSKPRILLVATDLSTGGGVNKVIRDLAALFSRQLSADVTVVNARSARPPSYAFPEDVMLKSHGRRTLGSYFRLLLSLRRSRPDVIISSWTHDNILVVLAFLFSRSKVILMEHTSWDHHGPGLRLLRRITYRLASQVIVLNPSEVRYYSSFLKNVGLLPNPIFPPHQSSIEKREKLILAVGHLEPRKNFADAIRTMAQSGLEAEGWSLCIIGVGEQATSLGALIAELGLVRTFIHPPTSHLAEWYARASLTLVTARLEVFSLVLAEAMLRGVIPVAYATDGPSYILEDFPDHLVPVGDVKRMAESLVRFARAYDTEPLREALRHSIEERFSPDIVAAKWRELLS